MEDIELVIKIPENTYRQIQALARNGYFEHDICGNSMRRIANGTPLPKGHKRLIEDNFEVGPIFDKDGNRVGYKYITQEDLNNAQTIIEADKEQEDE